MELNEVLSDEKPKEEIVEQKQERPDSAKRAHREKEAAAVEEGRKRDEAGRFAREEKEKAEAKPEAEQKPEPKPEQKEELSPRERAAFAAMQDERRKRQELENRLAQIEQAQKQPPPKSFVEDPDGALARYQQEMQQQLSGAIVQTKVSATEAVARAQHKDYDQIVEVFGQVCQNTPGLYQQALASPNPAEFAYRIGKNYHDLQQAGSIEQLKERIEKEARIKVENEYKQKHEELEKLRQSLPSSLSEARGTNQQRVQYTGPTPLGAILK